MGLGSTRGYLIVTSTSRSAARLFSESSAFEESFGDDGGGFVFASDIDGAGGAQFDVGIDEGEGDSGFEEGGVNA